MFPYFHILGKTIGTYGICAVLGLVCCGLLACLLAKRLAVAYEDVILMMVAVGVSLVVGGHLLYGITNANILVALFTKVSLLTPEQFLICLGLCFGGMVFYGGFLGACVGLLIYTKFSKDVERGIAFDLFAVCIPLFHVFGRIGCFLSGCCYGVECELGFIVHGNTLVPEINDVRRLPVPLIEAVCNLAIFLILLRVFQKGKESGKMIFYYMLIYPVIRFILEFFRGDAIRGFLFGLSTSQWISIGLFAVAVWKLFFSKGKGKKCAVCAGVLLAMVLVIGGTMPATVAYATEESAQEAVTADGIETEDAAVDEADGTKAEDVTEAQTDEAAPATGETGAETTEEEPPFNTKEKFVIFTCCLFSVALCVVIGLYGNPNDRLKDKYKRARKQQMLQEKKKKEAEERAARKAAQDAKYAEELAQYEADVKAYEEAKAAKAAAKAAKKAEKEAKRK